MSEYQALGLSWHLWKPRIVLTTTTEPNHCVYTPRGEYIADITDAVGAYQHTHSMFGGFDTAALSISCSQADLETWWERGPGMHLEVVDEAGVIVWEGFVNSLEMSLGALTSRRGPLTEMVNQLYVVYQPYDTSTNPPTHGASKLLNPIERPIPQQVYGIWPEFINLNAGTVTLASQVGNMWITDNMWPRISQDISLGGQGAAPSVSFDCLGYAHMLKQTYYNSATGTVGASTKLAAILNFENAYTNGLFSSTNASIATNATALPACETDYVDMNAQIQEIVSVGDAGYNRYVFLVEAGRFVTYAALPSLPAYRLALNSTAQHIETFDGNVVQPWAVRSGQWTLFTDLLPAMNPQSSKRQDPRFMLIERVQFTAPYDVSLNGGRADRIDQRMAQFGLENAT